MESALVFKVETLENKILTVAAKSTKIFPLQNFALYSNSGSHFTSYIYA